MKVTKLETKNIDSHCSFMMHTKYEIGHAYLCMIQKLTLKKRETLTAYILIDVYVSDFVQFLIECAFLMNYAQSMNILS